MANDDVSGPPDPPASAEDDADASPAAGATSAGADPQRVIAMPDPPPAEPGADLLPPPHTVDRPEPPLALALRRFDEALGGSERVIIAALFASLVCIGFWRTLSDLLWNERPLWAVEGIRVSVFAIAMLGAAFATHHKRNFNLDVLSRFFAPRGRAILRVILNVAAVGGAVLLFYGGWLVKATLSREHEYELVPKWIIGWFIPIAAALIIVHVVAHTIIELVYLADGRTAPEPEQGVA